MGPESGETAKTFIHLNKSNMKRTTNLLPRLCAMLLTLTATMGLVAQSSPFKYVDAQALPTSTEGIQAFSFTGDMLQMLPLGSLLGSSKDKGAQFIPVNVQPLLKKVKSLNIYIADTPEASKKLQEAFAPMLTPGLHRSIKQILLVNRPEDNLKVQIVSRESGFCCWRKCRELLISVLDEDEHIVVGLTGAFTPKEIKELISSASLSDLIESQEE